MDAHATDQFGNYKVFSINGHDYTPGDIIVALIAARALTEAMTQLTQLARTGDMQRAWNATLAERCDTAETWVALLEAERRTSL